MSEKKPTSIYRDTAHERMFESSSLNVEEAHERAAKTLADNEIKPNIFAGLYDDSVLRRDAEEVKRLEGIFEKSSSKIYADILEAIVCEHGKLSEWFGAQSRVIKTARFDDYKNKIDMVVETDEGKGGFSRLALGIDVTFGSVDLREKFERIKANIDKSTLGEVKYFHSDRQHFTERLRKVPQVVVGVEIERVKELGLLWMNRKNKELGEHPVQIMLLEEAALQLGAFAAYARRNNKDDVSVILEAELQKIKELLEEKMAAGIKAIAHDKVFVEIKRNLLSF